jgi:hypothetical protein
MIIIGACLIYFTLRFYGELWWVNTF